ncbi:hypothetical protein RND81_09G116600 [Saponaria officinalis]|uniref:Uncharacterized protein n=1 Tax=Saponaria officinalis TaxID=3572 RepID=A0AAW1ILP7_SAPOF
MANVKGSANLTNLMASGRNSLLPPKSPFPSITPTYTDYVPSTSIGSKSFSKSRDGNAYHQRTSSESFIEEQPTWLDELLDEPDTPVRKGHRRSSSDSVAYLDAASLSNIEYVPVSRDESKFRPVVSSPSWVPHNFDHRKETLQRSLYADSNFYGNRAWDSKPFPINHDHASALHSARDNVVSQSQGSHAAVEANSFPYTRADRQDLCESGSQDPKISSEKKDGIDANSSSENDTRRAKQQFAQRPRVRKLQYIAELEKNVQSLQVEGSEVSAELEFLDQQNLILGMENKALKQRLESLNQEKLIKYLEYKVLEREKGRLRALYQLQQQQQQQQVELQHQSRPSQRPSSSHRRNNSRDLDSRFSNLSLKS